MDAKNTVRPAVPIQPHFVQVAWTLLDPQGQVQKEPYFAIKILLTSLKQWDIETPLGIVTRFQTQGSISKGVSKALLYDIWKLWL